MGMSMQDDLPTQQILARITPIQTQHPPAVASEVCDLLPRCYVVESDDACVAACC